MCRADIPELAHKNKNEPNMVFPPLGFLDIVLNMNDDNLRENPPPTECGEITNCMYAMSAIAMLDTVLNGLTREQYFEYCERARAAETRA